MTSIEVPTFVRMTLSSARTYSYLPAIQAKVFIYLYGIEPSRHSHLFSGMSSRKPLSPLDIKHLLISRQDRIRTCRFIERTSRLERSIYRLEELLSEISSCLLFRTRSVFQFRHLPYLLRCKYSALYV